MATKAYVARVNNTIQLRISSASFIAGELYFVAAQSSFPSDSETYEDNIQRCTLQYEASAATINREIASCQGYNK